MRESCPKRIWKLPNTTQQNKLLRSTVQEYDGVWFGHYGQWFFLTFYYIGIFIVVSLIAIGVANAAGWCN
jgi:hypothetical protein